MRCYVTASCSHKIHSVDDDDEVEIITLMRMIVMMVLIRGR